MSLIATHQTTIPSAHLGREVGVDFYLPDADLPPKCVPLLLFNDGQLLLEIGFNRIFHAFLRANPDRPLLVAGIHAGTERLLEYGTSGVPNYNNQGTKAESYTRFVLAELLQHTLRRFPIIDDKDISYAGFSLGGLSALDMVWNHPHIFAKVGVFSGSFWWRSKALGKGYDDDRHRIMHQLIRRGRYHPGLTFYFECGTLDETADRNNNGVIDSIDDTLDIIKELENKGYQRPNDIVYREVQGGKHDVATWAMCMPDFLLWGWGDREARSVKNG